MASKMSSVMSAAQAGFRQLDAELAASQQRHLRRVMSVAESGNDNIAHEFGIEQSYRLVYVRCHFSSGAGTATFKVRLRSRLSSDWDTDLMTLTARGTGADVNHTIPGQENIEPSPWAFLPGDLIRCEWTNPAPGTMKWGLEIGLALAS